MCGSPTHTHISPVCGFWNQYRTYHTIPVIIPQKKMAGIDARGFAVLFGDSITQQSFSPGGWGARTADYFVRKVRRSAHSSHATLTVPRCLQLDIYNRGFGRPPTAGSCNSKGPHPCRGRFSGYTTSTAKKILPHVFPATLHGPAFVTIFFGANDASSPVHNPFQHVPLAAYAAAPAACWQHEPTCPALSPIGMKRISPTW